MHHTFIVARNPEADSSLPYLVFLPIDGGTWLKARETWPRSSRVYCHPAGVVDTDAFEVLQRIVIVSRQRRGPVVDLVLDRGTNRRAQFVFTNARGRPMIFWQTSKAAANARPGLRVPQRPGRALDRIAIDTRERYGYTFKGREVEIARVALRVGDYAAFVDGTTVAVVERKTIDDFSKSLVDGTLGFAMGELAQLGTAAVVVEGTYTQLLRRSFVDGAWLGDLMVRLQVRYPAVPIVFTETRALGERWTFALFAAAAAERNDTAPAFVALVDEKEPPIKRRAVVAKGHIDQLIELTQSSSIPRALRNDSGDLAVDRRDGPSSRLSLRYTETAECNANRACSTGCDACEKTAFCQLGFTVATSKRSGEASDPAQRRMAACS